MDAPLHLRQQAAALNNTTPEVVMSEQQYTFDDGVTTPVCPLCGQQTVQRGIQDWSKYNKPSLHYCECRTPGCQLNTGSTLTKEGFVSYLMQHFGLSEAEIAAAQGAA